MRSQNSVGFPYNILLIEMLLKSQIILFNPTTLIRLIVCMGRVCRGPTLKWAEMTRFPFRHSVDTTQSLDKDAETEHNRKLINDEAIFEIYTFIKTHSTD